MKFLYLLLIAFTTTISFAQEEQDKCDYKINIDTEEEQFKLTHQSLTEFMVGANQTVFIYFSLMKEGKVKSVVLHLSLNSMKMPPLICYNNKSRLSFKLESGEFVAAPYLGIETCGRQTENEESLSNSMSEASFYLDEQSLKRLSGSPIETMRVSTMNTNFDINFQALISNDQLKEPIYPRRYFIENISCIE